MRSDASEVDRTQAVLLRLIRNVVNMNAEGVSTAPANVPSHGKTGNRMSSRVRRNLERLHAQVQVKNISAQTNIASLLEFLGREGDVYVYEQSHAGGFGCQG